MAFKRKLTLELFARCLAIAIGWCALSALADDADSPTLRVMSFNIRYANPRDGENRWDARKTLVVDTIGKFDPDLLGTQEVLSIQGDYLTQKLPGYKFVGVGRDDGQRKGEFSPVMFKLDRFELLDEGHFWLSEHPDQPGSMSWDAACTRIVTWVKLRDRKQQAQLVVLNTHWDHIGAISRLEAAKMIRGWLADKAADLPVIVIGDFNCGERTLQYREMLGTDTAWPKLVDTFRAVVPEPGKQEASFHDFTGNRTGIRIDWILASEHFTPLEAAIDTTSRDGRYPSDHFPVTAVVRWKTAGK